MNFIDPSVHSNVASTIREETARKLRSFLYELAEGVTTYRTVHSLTEQVQHQYHGRFAIELIQNAYDALTRDADLERSRGRIEMRLVMDSEFGTLYVANDGAPFSESNFRSVSRLGQSDKSPETSIGNKGIGFRSVLEISKRPQIWSKLSSSSKTFDGYCFHFDPEFVNSILDPICAMLDERPPSSSSAWFGAMIDWDRNLMEKLRNGVRRQATAGGLVYKEWLRTQLSYLSPYLLPWPLAPEARSDEICDLERDGFSTVVALPMISASSTSLVEQKLAAFNADALLFLNDLRELKVSVPDGTREFMRKTKGAPVGPRRLSHISIGPKNQLTRFRTWSRELLVSEMPEPVQSSILALPGQWPKLSKVDITFAIRTCSSPEPGKLSIFLPTALESGTALHINAPFFGDMSRTTINFGASLEELQGDAVYNDFLLKEAAILALEAITEDLAGGSPEHATDIIDILSPNSTDEMAVRRWQEHLLGAAAQRGLIISHEQWFKTDTGWTTLSEAFALPLAVKPAVLTAAFLRQHATFSVFASEMDGRAHAIERLSKAFELDVQPSFDDRAATIESMASALHAKGTVNWGGFWQDVCEMLENDLSHLKGRKVVLCTDGSLHAGGVEGRAIYFKPRQPGPDEDGPDEQAIDQIPAVLQPFIAILDPMIPVTEVAQGRRINTNLHKQLAAANLVEQFRREEVLTNVIIPNLPPMPVRHGTPDVTLCRDALAYAIRLAQSMEARGDRGGILRAMAKLPVPCRGGWFPLATTCFGKGWAGTLGAVVDRYLKLSATESARSERKRLLRSPDDMGWSGMGSAIEPVLQDAGVYKGLRLFEIRGEHGVLNFETYNNTFILPETPPAPVGRVVWSRFRTDAQQQVRPVYKAGKYKAEVLYWIPGFEEYSNFDEATRVAFYDAVMASASEWPDAWQSTELIRYEGLYSHITRPSPLFLGLSELDWFAGSAEDGTPTWSKPSERWFVPTRHIARGRAWTFEHLSPLSFDVAGKLEQSEGLTSFLVALGMPVYEPEKTSDNPRLLTSLIRTAEQKSYRNKDVFLGQLRAAWDAFHPDGAEDFPAKIVVHQPDGSLVALVPGDDFPVYLPSERTPLAALRDFDLPVVAIEPGSARRLSGLFTSAYGSRIRNSASFEMTAFSEEIPWDDNAQDLLSEFGELDGTIPFLLTIAAFHGANAQGTASRGFIDLIRNLKEARVSVVSELTIVPMIDDQEVAASRRQPAVWLGRKGVLVLDPNWREDIEAVADAFTQLTGRSDLRFQNRKGLSEIWQSSDDQALNRVLRQMDLTPEYYREVLELWRGDLGPAVSRLTTLMGVLSRQDLISRLETAEQREQILAVLCDALADVDRAEQVLDSAFGFQGAYRFGLKLREILGPQVELSAWNSELSRVGEAGQVNPQSGAEFSMHKEQALPFLRRVVATLSASTLNTPSYSDCMKKIDALGCPDALSRMYWELPFAEVVRAIGDELVENGLPTQTISMLELIMTAPSQDLVHAVSQDPIETAAQNRKQVVGLTERLKIILSVWYATGGIAEDASWLAGFTPDPAASLRFEDRDFYTLAWDEKRVIAFISSALPVIVTPKLRQILSSDSSLQDVMEALGVSPEQLSGAEAELVKARNEAARRKNLVVVCGAEIENTESGLLALFDHIAARIKDADLLASAGFDPLSPLIPRKAGKPSSNPGRRDRGRTHAPRRSNSKIEDVIGAAGEIHAFRWLQLKYGSMTVSLSNWVSAYSAKAFPDNVSNVDEGRGCDIFFTHEGCTFNIEVKSSEGDFAGFTLGTSEIRLAREISTSRRTKHRQEYLVLQVSNVLSNSPSFTLLPNPYDHKYADRFVIVDDGARVTYRK